MMALTGYKRSCGRRSGGIRSVALIRATDVVTASYDRESDTYTDITVTQGSAFAEYHFKEDEAVYSAVSSYANGSYIITHQLSFVLEKVEGGAALVVEELADASPCGIVAVVKTNNDSSLLVGYSEKFGTERALRLEKSSGTTGLKLSDLTAETITLLSQDTAKAKVFSGELPL